ncbi:MAG: Lrp/AsnC family transcriptional regulator [Cognatishimia sp.]|uniref:Lrp/AsnC family transcriptional regulator n=1 Tax=Cognatishimia sp. TaxID=2211648 RepID=UPI004057E9BC
MDDLDHKLISELRNNARASLSQLAAILGVTRTTVRQRLERLQSRGDIVGFTVVLNEPQRDAVRALMMIGIEGRGIDRIVRQLGGITAVRNIHTTNGRWDLIVELGTDTLVALDQIILDIRRFDGVSNSETNLLLNTRKQS